MTPPHEHEAEWLTRKKRIDTKLASPELGWKIISHKESLDLSTLDHHAVTEFPTENGPADYALFVKGKLFVQEQYRFLKCHPSVLLLTPAI